MVFVRHKRDPVRLMWRRLFTLLFFALLVILLRGVWDVYQKEGDSRALRREAEVELHDLRLREVELRSEISSLSTERGREEALRHRFNVGKEDEGMVVIVEPVGPERSLEPTNFERVKGWLAWW